MVLGRTGFARKGEWIAAVTYDALDIVTHEGKVYIGRRESVGSEPSSESNDWAMLPGAPSFEIEETASGYDLTITGSDGTSETISILNGEVDREELEDALEAFRSSTDAYLAPDYDDTVTYSAGDSCVYDGRLYRCIEDIPTAEPWTMEHWEPVVLSNKVAQMRKDAEVKADVVVSSAEPGGVVSFDDGADNVPVKELVVGIEPVQNLNGQDAPYPPGGGKNKLNTVLTAGFPSDTSYSNATKRTFTLGTYVDGLTYNNYFNKRSTSVSVAENRIAFTTSASAYGISIPVVGLTPGSQYTLSATVTNGRLGLSFYAQDGTWLSSGSTPSSAVNTYTATVPNDAYYTVVVMSSDTVDVESVFTNIQLESGSSATAYAPYSNICPISGWTGVEVYQAKKNLFDESEYKNLVSDYEYISNSYRCRAIQLTPYTTYTVSQNAGTTDNLVLLIHKQRGVNGSGFLDCRKASDTKTFTTNATGCLYIGVYSGTDETVNARLALCKVQIELGSSATSYEAFNGNTYPISWQSEAGTVYGCNIDPVSGVLTVTHGIADMGDTNWSKDPNRPGVFYGSISGRRQGSDILACSAYRVRNVPVSTSYDCYVSGTFAYGANYIFFRDASMTSFTTAQVKTAVTGYKVVYELATPLVFQLTPTQIRSLFGVNTFWSNSNGGIQSLQYVSDLKLYLEQLTKPTEDDMIANSNIPANTYFTIGNALYLSTAAIAAGEKIEPDTNCTRKSLADALNDLHG